MNTPRTRTIEFSAEQEAFLGGIFEHEKCQHFTEQDKRYITLAYNIASRAHKEQRRGDGRPYISHIERTTKQFLDVAQATFVTAEDIIVAILHDTIEDHPSYIGEVRNTFPNTEIYYRVLALSKPNVKITTTVYTDFVRAIIANPPLFFRDYSSGVTFAHYYISTFGQKPLTQEEIEGQKTLFRHLSELGTTYTFGKLRDFQNYQFFWMVSLLKERDFEIKVADRLDNLDDLEGVDMEYIEKNIISTKVYILKAEALGRLDLKQLLEEGMSKLEIRKTKLSTGASSLSLASR